MARAVTDIAQRARDKKLPPAERLATLAAGANVLKAWPDAVPELVAAARARSGDIGGQAATTVLKAMMASTSGRV